ncbi:MAG: hypothetical protein KJZ54_10425 [Phycisphaerales bacterium]|nr:hypothetical protein [Phycisphaerales bacterium]
MIETDYDVAGRVLHRRATATGSGIDTAVLRISTAYTARGQVDTVTQHDHATVGSGNVVDEVQYAYDEWGQVTAFDQDWNSAVGATGSVDDLGVAYTHALALSPATGVYRALRTTGTTLPDSTAVAYTYDSTDGRHDADLGRVSRVQVGATDVARYEYNGAATLVGTELLEADLLYTRYDLNGDFARIDRFGRVTEDHWTRGIDTGGSPDYDVYRDLYDVHVFWDRASNVTRVEDKVYPGWDVGYSLDGRDRLTRAERGTWGGASIGSLKQDERWTLTQTGNWDLHRLDLNGDGDFLDSGELDDRGTFNVVNELLARDIDDDTSDDFTLTYDAAGHLTDDGENHEYVYDAFGRLRFVKDTSDQEVVAEYTYNGLGYRTGWHYDVDADGTVEANTEHNADDPWFHFVYDTRWRIVAVYRVRHWKDGGGWTFDADPKERFVYHNAGLAGGRGSLPRRRYHHPTPA